MIEDIECKFNFTPPIIRFKTILEDFEEYNIDISGSNLSIYKLALLVQLFNRHPFLVPVINYLGMILKKADHKNIISSFGFSWMIIYLLDQLDHVKAPC